MWDKINEIPLWLWTIAFVFGVPASVQTIAFWWIVLKELFSRI